MDDINTKSYTKVYWWVWLLIVLAFITIRLLIGHDLPENSRFGIFIAYALLTWIPVMVINLVEGFRLNNYLEKYHHEKWNYLTYDPMGAWGIKGMFRMFPFLYSKDNLDDPKLVILKKNYRDFITLSLTIFFTMPVMFIVIMLVIKA